MTVNTLPAPRAASLRQTLSHDRFRMLVVIALLIAIFSTATHGFLSVRTFQAIAGQMPALTVAAVGMTFVLLLGQIDLSVGSLLGLGGALVGVAITQWHWPVALAAVFAIAVTGLCGLLSGWLMVQWRLPSFIVTLGMLEAARGATYLVTHSQTQYIGGTLEAFAEAHIAGVPLVFVLALALVAAASLVMRRTVFGRYLTATGTNEEAVRLAGINTRQLKCLTFMGAGALAGLAAVLHTSRLGAADPNAGTGFELQTIAAVVIGGTSLMGGRASVTGTLFGVLIISLLDTGLAQVGAQEPAKRLVTGIVIVAAVIFDNYRHRRSS
ncbi:MAG: ABC transporter permease [Deltaproteobacteria bacterium]|nr:ABC transporter permease [Deltaproteobacteria bacterium]